jgi:hypothetical protein
MSWNDEKLKHLRTAFGEGHDGDIQDPPTLLDAPYRPLDAVGCGLGWTMEPTREKFQEDCTNLEDSAIPH